MSTGGYDPADTVDPSIPLAYARLVRLPNVFTAPPDVILGAALVAWAGHTVALPALAGIAVASMLLYAAGTSLNDYFDADEDARERPDRPIPSGAVSAREALVFGTTCLVGGIVLAYVTGGSTSGAFASLLAALILLYDGAFKDTALGFLLMGSTRGVNIIFGASVATTTSVFSGWQPGVPVLVSIYIAAVTYMAESESGTVDRSAVRAGFAVTIIAAFGAATVLTIASPPLLDTTVGGACILVFLLWTTRAFRKALARPVPETIGPAVGTCVLGLSVLNAAFAAVAGFEWSLAALGFLLPAVGLSRVFDVS